MLYWVFTWCRIGPLYKVLFNNGYLSIVSFLNHDFIYVWEESELGLSVIIVIGHPTQSRFVSRII